jgi:hypothetical protein
MRRVSLLFVAALGIVACGSPASKQDSKAPANEPAVVSAPVNVPTPVAEPASKKSALIPDDQRQVAIILSQGYGLATATMIHQDARMLGQLYAPDAVLHVPDSTVTGLLAVTHSWLEFAHSRSLTEFQRITRGQRILDDSTLTDSGTYQMIFKRTEKDSVTEHGAYRTTWRARRDISKWVMLEDAIRPGKSAKNKGAK